MARVVKEIEIGGRTLKALFDTGSVRSYLTAPFRPETTHRVPPMTVGLGGTVRRLDERCIVTAKIDGLEFDITPYIVDELGHTEFGRIDAIVGALTMEEWWIKVDPHANTLDLSKLREPEFTEYVSPHPSSPLGEEGGEGVVGHASAEAGRLYTPHGSNPAP